jgi:invasion protein IalB
LSPSADDTRKLVDALGMGNSLLVEISPYAQAPVEVSFDLTGFSEKLDELNDACR